MDLSRAENSAEHSWHVALYAMVFGASDRAIAMILLHDLVEIDTGDQPIHLDHDTRALAAAEARAAVRIFGLAPEGARLAALWRAFEGHADPDAVTAKRMDHVQPVFQVLLSPAPLPDHVAIARDNLERGRAARLAQEWPEAMAAAQAVLRGRRVGDDRMRDSLSFLARADRMKSLPACGQRNAAERNWLLALHALVPDRPPPDIDPGRVIRMLLVHDLDRLEGGSMTDLLPSDRAAALSALQQEFALAGSPEAQWAHHLIQGFEVG